MSAHAIWLAVAITAQAPAEIPEEWTRDLRAAAAAIKARDFAKVEALLVQVTRASQQLDDNDARQLVPLERLALFYLTDEIGRPADAEPLLRRMLTVQERTCGLESPELADTLILLAACRLEVDPKAGKEAEQLEQRALSITEKVHGKDDLRTAAVLHSLARGQIRRKQYEPAERTLERAIAIREKAQVLNDLKLADCLDSLGDLHSLERLTLAWRARSAQDHPEPLRKRRFAF